MKHLFVKWGTIAICTMLSMAAFASFVLGCVAVVVGVFAPEADWWFPFAGIAGIVGSVSTMVLAEAVGDRGFALAWALEPRNRRPW